MAIPIILVVWGSSSNDGNSGGCYSRGLRIFFFCYEVDLFFLSGVLLLLDINIFSLRSEVLHAF